MTLFMGLFTNRAYALAPGLGINAVVAFSLVAAGGLTMPQAMGIVVMEGIVITILVLTGLRTAIFKAIPLPLKKAIAIGIGFFILFIGLVDGGVVIIGRPSSTPLLLGNLIGVPVAVTLFGLIITIIMLARNWKAAILLGILFSTVFAIILNYAYNKNPFGTETAVIPHKIFAAPDFSIVGKFNFGSFSKLGIAATILWVFSLMLSDFFDTMGTLIGVGGQAGYLDKNGDLPDVVRPLVVDSIAAIAGGVVSSSSATTYIESGSGVGVGGRTGWVGVIVALLFAVAMFFSPIAGVVPANATAPALIIVGYMMMRTLTEGEGMAEHEDTRPQEGLLGHRLLRPRLRPAGRPDHDHHAAHLQHHERHRRRLHRLLHHPHRPGQGQDRELDDVRGLDRLPHLLHVPVHPPGVQPRLSARAPREGGAACGRPRPCALSGVLAARGRRVPRAAGAPRRRLARRGAPGRGRRGKLPGP